MAQIVTSPITAEYLMHGQLAFWRAAGFEVHLIAAPGRRLEAVGEREGIGVTAVPMRREISPLHDLVSLWRLWRTLARLAPDLAVAGTPKGGVLGMVAARLAGVPRRVYVARGLRLETAAGGRRLLLALAERTAWACAHQVVCVSESLRRRSLELGLGPASKTRVPGCGSSNGVDVERFHPRWRLDPATAELRRRLGIPADAPVIGFVGRLTRDKGVADLAHAFESRVLRRHPAARLVLLGELESGDEIPPALRARIRDDRRIVHPGFVDRTESYYALFDVVAFPSYREGFPNVPLEAAASAVPVAGYAATGTVDAVEDGVTGTLTPVGDVAALGSALCAYLDDPALRRLHGEAGRARAERSFRRELVWNAWLEILDAPLAEGR